MARIRGVFNNSANYEPLISAPFDARSLVALKSDLFLASTWQQSNGARYIYAGMLVCVYRDTEANNGLYILKNVASFTKEEGWLKLADITQINNLNERVDKLEETEGASGGLDINVDTFSDLPSIGDPKATYYVKDSQDIYRWSEVDQKYVNYSSNVEDINIIYGGDSNG